MTRVALVALVAFAAPPAARAQDCARGAERVEIARERLRADAHAGRVWTWSWGLGFTALALGQAGLALTRDDPGERAELMVGAGKTVLGLGSVLVLPVRAVRESGLLEAHLAGARPEDRCALAAEAELMLERSADDEAFARSWLAHAGVVAVNGGGLLIVGLGYGRWLTGTLGALVGTAVGEVQIFTRPAGALAARRSAAASGVAVSWTAVPLLGSGLSGISVAGSY